MKLLRHFDNETEAEELALRLRSRGIMPHVSSSATRHLGAHNAGSRSLGVWAVLDAQHADAVALLDNPDHTVSHPLTEEDMDAIENATHRKVGRNLDTLLNFFAITVLLTGVAVVVWLLLSG